MIELRRRSVRPIQRGDLCNLRESTREIMKSVQDYQDNGNISGHSSNYNKKLHVADVQTFYVCNDNPFNSSKMLEVIPVSFIYDNTYSTSSFDLALRKRMKLTMPRENFSLIMVQENEDNYPLLINCIEKAGKKYNLNLDQWRTRNQVTR